MNCQNCNGSIDESSKYCSECGQYVSDKLTIGHLFKNTIANYFSVDSRFFKSFIPLLFKPGYLATEFCKGKRSTYLHPAQYYLFVSVILFFLVSLATRNVQDFDARNINFDQSKSDSLKINETLLKSLNLPSSDSLKLNEDTLNTLKLNEKEFEFDSDALHKISFNFMELRLYKKIDSLNKRGKNYKEIAKSLNSHLDNDGFEEFLYSQLYKLIHKGGQGIIGIFMDTLPVAMFFLLPIFAFLLKIFFWRRGGFAYHVVWSYYYFSVLFALWSLTIFFGLIFEISTWWYLIPIFYSLIYFFIALKKFYSQRKRFILLKGTLMLLIFSLLIIPLSLVILSIISFVNY